MLAIVMEKRARADRLPAIVSIMRAMLNAILETMNEILMATTIFVKFLADLSIISSFRLIKLSLLFACNINLSKNRIRKKSYDFRTIIKNMKNILLPNLSMSPRINRRLLNL